MDIHQGYIGDCYFLGALAAFAVDTDKINKVLINKRFTSSYAITANVRIRGMPKTMGVDFYMPFYMKSSTFLFASYEQAKISWVAGLEKMWAKTNRNYDGIVGGDPIEVLEWLAGMPGFTYSLQYPPSDLVNVASVWTYVRWAWSKKHAMTFSTPNGSGISKYGITLSHTYAITGVEILYDKG